MQFLFRSEGKCARPILYAWVVGLLFIPVMGCGRPAPQTGDPTKKISWEEFVKMNAEEQDDPYVVENLDEDAKKKLEKQKSKNQR